jgi:hypothetical protein
MYISNFSADSKLSFLYYLVTVVLHEWVKQSLLLVSSPERVSEKYCWFRISPNKHTIIFNLLKPTCYVMHQQFNIQQLYALPTLYLCVLYLSENKQRLVSLTS